MGKVILTVVFIFIVGVVCMVIGNDLMNGFTELGTISAIAVTGGLVVYLDKKKK